MPFHCFNATFYSAKLLTRQFEEEKNNYFIIITLENEWDVGVRFPVITATEHANLISAAKK